MRKRLLSFFVLVPAFFSCAPATSSITISSDPILSSSLAPSSTSSTAPSSSSLSYPCPIEDTEDESLLITTKTLIKLPVPNPESDSYLIPNSTVTIVKGQTYTDLNEVAAYLMAFKEMPENYYPKSERSTCTALYGSDCRLVGSSEYHNNGYSNSPIMTDGATNYHEMDVGTYEGFYSTGARGAFRLVYSVDPGHEIVYFTDCHYQNFSEYYNYYNGFGPWWGNGDKYQDFNRYPDTVSHPEREYQAPVVGLLDFSVPYPQN